MKDKIRAIWLHILHNFGARMDVLFHVKVCESFCFCFVFFPPRVVGFFGFVVCNSTYGISWIVLWCQILLNYIKHACIYCGLCCWCQKPCYCFPALGLMEYSIPNNIFPVGDGILHFFTKTFIVQTTSLPNFNVLPYTAAIFTLL